MGFIGLLLLWRFSLLGYEQHITTFNTNPMVKFNYLRIISFLISIILFTISFHHLLHTLFYKDLIKIHLYLKQYSWYDSFIEKITLFNFTNFLYQFVQGVLSYILEQEDMNESNIEYYESFEILKKQSTWEKATVWRNISKRYYMVYIFIKMLYHYLKDFEAQILRTAKILQSSIVILGCIEFFNHKIYYFYYAMILSLVITLWLQYRKFLRGKDGMYIQRLEDISILIQSHIMPYKV